MHAPDDVPAGCGDFIRICRFRWHEPVFRRWTFGYAGSGTADRFCFPKNIRPHRSTFDREACQAPPTASAILVDGRGNTL